MLIDNPDKVTGDLVLKCQVGKNFDELRNIMKNENIDGLFSKSCFAYFLELPANYTLCFPMNIVYGLLKRRIKYARNDKDSKEGKNKMDEIWINYCGMPIYFGLKEFVIVKGLRCDRPEEPLIKETPYKGFNKYKKKKMEKKDGNVKKVIEDDLLVLADDFEKFNDYPWVYDNYYLAVEYLVTKLCPKTTTLYDFSWAFMTWAYKVIPPLQKQFKIYPDEVSHPKILRWLAANGSKIIKEVDLFNHPDDAVLLIQIRPTVKLIKMKLAGATTIRKVVRQGQPNVETLHEKPTATNLGASSRVIAGGVVDNGGSHLDAPASTNRDYEHVCAQENINVFKNTPCTIPSHPYIDLSHPYNGPPHPFLPLFSHYKCKRCKDREDKLLENIEAIAKATEELKSKWGVIPSKKLREPYTPTVAVRRKTRNIRQILSIVKTKKITTPPAPRVVEVQGQLKKVDIYAAPGYEKKKELQKNHE
ncbi:hypothetical protein P3S68_020726 [Capsicum galapagoense]